jgi:hypothetical protein
MWQIASTIALLVAVVALGSLVWHLVSADRRRTEARIAALASAIDDRHWTPQNAYVFAGSSATDMDTAFAPEPRRLNHAALLVSGGVLAVLGTITLLLLGGSGGRETSALVASANAPIELVSMHHAREGDTLIVSGLVRNPSELATPALTAVVSAIDRAGRVVARGSRALEPVVLGPGKETSFRVTVANARDLGRYRLGFVNENRVVPHVDRRRGAGQAPAADRQ